MLIRIFQSAWRNIYRRPLFSLINIGALSISLMIGLLLIGVLWDVFEYDRFHINYEGIYRVNTKYSYLNDDRLIATTTRRLEDFFLHNTSWGKDHVATLRYFSGDIDTGEKIIPLSGYVANPDFLKVFSFPMIQGSPDHALKNPFSMVLTKSAAQKLFGRSDVFGKTIFYKGQPCAITGILDDIPMQSHLKFEVLCALPNTRAKEADLAWDDVWSSYVYIFLPTEASAEKVSDMLARLSSNEESLKQAKISFDLQPLGNIMFNDTIGNQTTVIGAKSLWVFGGLSLVVILCAGFNYVNLSVAEGVRRSREVGVRKVLGAGRIHILTQFVVEGVLISMLSLLLAVMMFVMVRPQLLSLQPEFQTMFSLKFSWPIAICFAVFALVVGLIVGIFPSLFYDRFSTLEALKKASLTSSPKRFSTVSILVTTQFVISIIFITTSVGMYYQYRHFMMFDVGYNPKNFLNIDLGEDNRNSSVLQNELAAIPTVEGVSQSSMITGVKGFEWNTVVRNGSNPYDSVYSGLCYVDENYLPLHQHEFLAGRNFNNAGKKDATGYAVVTEALLRELNSGKSDLEKAIGEVLIVGKEKVQIIGVVKDFQFDVASEAPKRGVVFLSINNKANWLNVKLSEKNQPESMSRISEAWKKADPAHPLIASRYEDQLELSYSGFKTYSKTSGFVAVLAMSIALMGLLGMVVFIVEIRMKEVGIRKVLGSSTFAIIYELGKRFFQWLAIASLVGVLVTYYIFNQVLLIRIANPAPVPIVQMCLAVVVTFGLAMVIVIVQALKAAWINPVDILKSEG